MGRKSTDSTTQTKTKAKHSGSGSSSRTPKPAKASTSTAGETPKPPSTVSKKSRAVGLDEGEVGGPSDALPTKRKKSTVTSSTTEKSVDDKPKPSTSEVEGRSKSKLVKSPLTAANPRGNLDSKSVKKKQKVVPEPVEADSEESEQEWVGFGGVEDEEEEDGEEEDGDSSEEELLHGLSSDDQDSSDEEVELPDISVPKLPTIAKDDKVVKQKLEKAKRQPVRITLTTDIFPPRGLISVSE